MENQGKNRKNNKKSAALYVRANNMEALSRQVILGTHFANAKGYNLPLNQIYSDVCSGNAVERPGFRKMIAESRKRKFNTVVVTGIERLARNPEQAFMMNMELTINNLRLKVAN